MKSSWLKLGILLTLGVGVMALWVLTRSPKVQQTQQPQQTQTTAQNAEAPQQTQQRDPKKPREAIEYDQKAELGSFSNPNFQPVMWSAPPTKAEVKAATPVTTKMAIATSRNPNVPEKKEGGSVASRVKDQVLSRVMPKPSSPQGAASQSAQAMNASISAGGSGGGSGPRPLMMVASEGSGSGRAGRVQRSGGIAPMGRFIRCDLVNTLETTASPVPVPVIGIVTEDFKYNGRVLIPAGSEVHGYQGSNYRERITAQPSWNIVFKPTREHPDGSRIRLSGVVFHRDELLIDEKGNVTRGDKDLSPGFSGFVVKDMNKERFLMAMTAAIQSAAMQLQERTQATTTQASVVDSTGRNALLAGAAGALKVSMEEMERQIKENGYYTVVPGGTQFFLYIQEDIDVSKAGLFEAVDGQQAASPVEQAIEGGSIAEGFSQLNMDAFTEKISRIASLHEQGVIPANVMQQLVTMTDPLKMDRMADDILNSYE